jgi:hypothetical protein
MTYLRALQLLTKAYKAAKGRLPEGLDLLKVKQKARQKAIDSNKVIDAAAKFDKGNWFRLNKKPAKAGFGKPKKVETEAEMLARMKKQNKEAVQRLKEKKKPREDKATGGLTNISETYDANPTLQAQFPDKQDYLDLFSSTTTTTTTQPQTYSQMTQQSTAGIPAAKRRIFPLDFGQDGDDSGKTRIGTGRTDRNQPNYMGGKTPGIIGAAQRLYSDLAPTMKYNPMNPMFMFNVGKKTLSEAREFARQIEQQKQQERIERARAKARARAAIEAAGSGYDYDPGGGNYGMGFGPGRSDPTDKS